MQPNVVSIEKPQGRGWRKMNFVYKPKDEAPKLCFARNHFIYTPENLQQPIGKIRQDWSTSIPGYWTTHDTVEEAEAAFAQLVKKQQEAREKLEAKYKKAGKRPNIPGAKAF